MKRFRMYFDPIVVGIACIMMVAGEPFALMGVSLVVSYTAMVFVWGKLL